MMRSILVLLLLAFAGGCDSDRKTEREILLALDQVHKDYLQAATPAEKVKVLERRLAMLERSRSIGARKDSFIAHELCFAYLSVYVWESAQANHQAARAALLKADEINRTHSLGALQNIDLTDPSQAAFIAKSIQTLDDGLAESFAKNPVVR
jgi:hypothetical protein